MFKFVRFAAALVASATSALLQVPSQANITSSSYLQAPQTKHVQMASSESPWMPYVQARATDSITFQMSRMGDLAAVKR